MEGNAKWIWLNRSRYPDNQNSSYTFFCEKGTFCVALFRKKIVLKDNSAKVYTQVSADCKYILKVNGKTVSRGPAVVGGDYGNTQPLGYRFYDEPALSFLKGENIIEAFVSLQPVVESDYSDGHGGFIFYSEIQFSDGSVEKICSDESWETAKDNRFVREYETDYTKEPEPFSSAGIAEYTWNLEKKDIPELRGEIIRPINGSRFVVLPGKSVTVDFGKVYTGYFFLQGMMSCAKNSNITLEFFEKEGFPIVFRDTGKEYLRVKSGLFSFENLNLRSARYVNISIDSGQLELSCEWEWYTYPVQYKGYFRCSDERLNRIYDVCVRTTQNCMNTYHMDSPIHQEALGCTGDYFIQSLINYYSFGDYKLTRLDIVRDARYFRLKGGHRVHTSYAMIWVQWCRDYVLYSGDHSIYYEIKDALEILMARYESYLDEDGIVSKPHSYWFIDWSFPKGVAGLQDTKIVWQAALTAFTYQGFVCAAEIMREIGEDNRAVYYNKIARKIRRGFNRIFWDNKRKLYFGGFEVDGSAGRRYFGVHENILAVLYDITDRDPVEIMRKVVTERDLTQAQPYFMHFMLLALKKTGLFETYGVEIILRWQQLLNECDSSLKEVWNGLEVCDYSHAWSATPGYIMPRIILGVYPEEEGWNKICFSPNLCGLEWAEGVVPTPQGEYYFRAEGNRKEMRKL